MRVVATIIRSILLLVVLTIIGWAFFDMGWRFFQHRQQLALRPVELTVMHWGEPAEDKIVDDLVQRFEKENPTVRIVRINAGGGFRTKLKTMMAAEVAPDVFYLPPEFVPEMAQQQLIAPLDQYFSKEPAEWRDDFYPLLLDGCRFDTTTNELGKGKLYGLPKDFSTSVFYINKDLFDKAGIDWQAIQKNGWNWDQFEVEMKKIRALNGTPPFAGREIYGAMLQIWPDSLRNMLWTYDGEFFEKKPDGTTDFNDLGFDQPGSIKAMDLITRMRLKDRTAFNATGVAKDGGAEFKAGNIGCVGPVGRWYVPQLKDPKSIKWDVLPVPAGSTRASQMFYNGWAMSAKSKHPDEAYRLIRFLCGREGQVQQGRAGLAIPALKSVANSPDFLEPEGIPKHDSQQFIDAIQHARIGQLPRQTEFTRMVEQTTNEAIQTGRRTPTEAADVLQAKWTSELNSPLRQKQWPAMPWATILSIAAAVLATVTALLW
ncbi:MAG TPA: sugar ABC transporter substrate-binding protein, partial [Tepidisphaeraceae bacterium]